MKKIVFLSKNLKIGGMEKALVILLNKLINHYKVVLILEEKEGILLNELDERVKIEEYKLSKNKNIFIRKILNFTKRFFWTLRNKNKYDFSCNYATYSVICSKLALIASNNNSLYVHSNYYDVYEGDKEKITGFFDDVFLEKFKNVFFVSNESKNNLLKIYPDSKDKFFVINNLVNDEEIRKLSREPFDYKFSSKTNFLFIGRLAEESKQLTLLIESFKKAIEKNKNIKLIIVGDGEDRDLIISKVLKYKINDYVDFLGEIVNPYPYMANTNYLIMTSKYEGFPLIYNEALVLNKKVLTTIPVSDEQIDVRDYFIISEKTSDAICDNILNLVNNKKTAGSNNINFDEINTIRLKKLIEIIEN